MSASLLTLPPETLGASILGRCAPADVAAAAQTCAVLAELCRSDPVLWRTVAHALYDDVEVGQARKLLVWEDGGERALDAVDVDWREVVTHRHRLATIVRHGDEDERIVTYNDVARMMLSVAANARVADEDAESRNAAFLQQLLASPEAVEFYLHRDFESLRSCSRTATAHPGEGVQTRSRSRSDLSGSVDPILSRRLHLLRGLFVPLPHPPPVLSSSSTALSRMARGRARETVYDLGRYSESNSFGPFLLDGSGRVDWVTLEAVSCVMGHNVHAALGEWRSEAAEVPHDPEAPAGEATGPYEVNPPRGDFADSLPWPAQPKASPADAIEVDGLPFDWAGVDGLRQATSYAFLDYRQLHLYNRHRDAAGNRHRLDRDIEGVGDIMRFSLRQCAPPEDKDEHVPASQRSDIVPPLFFSGTSVSAMLMRTRVRGSVWITPDRQIAWHYIISYGGEDRWSLRGVQRGAIVGTWTDAGGGADAPVGPWFSFALPA